METKTTVAIIDDDNSVRKSVALNLEQEGFKVLEAEDGVKGISLVEEKKPDVIILDIKMPRKDGFQVCKELRNKGISTPLILLTARSEEVDKVLGLELGADDYLAKPFGMLELVARVKALLRRNKGTKELEKIEFSGIKIDFKAYKAEKESKPIDLSAREYRLLKCLIAKKGSVVTRDELLDEVWGYNTYPTTRTVDNHIARLRQKIEEKNSKTPKHILTVHGVGYKFVV